MRAERFGHPAPAFSTSTAFTEEAHSLEHCCHVILARKENRGGGGGYALLREGVLRLRFHSLN